MLIKIFEVDKSLQGMLLTQVIKASVLELGFSTGSIQITFSDVQLFEGVNKIRVVITGRDAFRQERRIKVAVGEACQRYYEQAGVPFPGLSNPAMPNQKLIAGD